MPCMAVFVQAGVNACGERGENVQIVLGYDIYDGNIVQKRQISFGWGGGG